MGIIRGGLIILASIILFISLLLGNIFLITSLSLDYDAISPKLIDITTDIANNEANLNQIININHPLMIKNCKNETEIQLTDYSLPYNYTLLCNTIKENPETITKGIIEKIIEKAYYKNYNCKFSECLKSSPLYIISKTNKDNLKSKFNKTLILSLIMIVLIFLLVEKKRNTLTITGILLILASLPLIIIDFPIKIFSKIFGLISQTKPIENYLSELISLLFSKTGVIFSFNIALGVMLIALGLGLIILKFFGYEKDAPAHQHGSTPEGEKITKREVEDIVDKKINRKNSKKV